MRGHMKGKHLAWLVPLVLVAAAVVAGCGVGPVDTAKPTATPGAQTILQNAQKVKINDATFTLSFSGSFAGKTATGNGNGQITENPKRSHITLNFTSESQQFSIENITDTSTNASYSKISGLDLPGLSGDKWIKSSLGNTGGDATGSLLDTSNLTDYSALKNATLVGTEQINGYTCWHIKSETTSSGTKANADIYFRQDNYYPVEDKITTTGTAPGTFTITFTAINSGISIQVPPADQVQSLNS